MSLVLILSLLVKSSIVSGAGLLAADLVARSPSDRVDILRAVVCLLLALPIVTVLLPSIGLDWLPASPASSPTSPAPLSPAPLWSGVVGPVAGIAVSGALPWPSPAVWVAAAWTFGVLFVAGRFVLGVVTLVRWTHEGRRVTCLGWLAPLSRLTPSTQPRLVSSERLSSPLSWGAGRGVIVIDPASLAAPDTAPAVLAHELAHLRRRDWVFLVLSRLALALFWFNPLVWRLHAVLAARSEEAADAAALETVDARTYARTLVRLAALPASCPATAMAADARTLKRRIACIMTRRTAPRRPMAVALTVVALAVVGTPLAALELQQRLRPPAPPEAPLPPAPPAAPADPYSVSVHPAPPAPPAPDAPDAPDAPPAPPALPAPPAGSGYFISVSDAPETRRMADDARRAADEALQQASEALQQAVEARIQAGRHAGEAAEAAVHARAAMAAADIAQRQAGGARIQAEQVRVQAQVVEREAARQMVEARIQMRQGAVDMRRGAEDMRREAVRLRDPAYRAEVRARNRSNGRPVTDAELLDLSRKLPGEADNLDRQADRLARQGAA